jgi:4-hydroxy-3-methylbut-2-enyl diphosphate reductase
MDLALSELNRRGSPVYCDGPLLHNPQGLELLKNKGLILLDKDSLPPDLDKSVIIIRAHGLPPEEERFLRETGARIVDATCPKVAAARNLVRAESQKGYFILLWGTQGHPEVEGLLGYAGENSRAFQSLAELADLPAAPKFLLASQTTNENAGFAAIAAGVSELFPAAELKIRNTICAATVRRQEGLVALAEKTRAIVVVGGRDSGNTQRLAALAQKSGALVAAVEGPQDLPEGFGKDLEEVGVAAGASTPLWQIRWVCQALAALGREREETARAFVLRLARALVLSCLYVGLGAGAMGWALAQVLRAEPPGTLWGLFIAFATFMHLFNGFLDRDSARYNDPDRADFIGKYWAPLVFLDIGCLALSLSGAYLLGRPLFYFVAAHLSLSLLYFVPWPWAWARRRGPRSCKDIPCSKTLCTSAGWAFLLTGPLFFARPPALSFAGGDFFWGACAWLAVFLQVLSRVFLMDLEEARGDRIFGKKSPAAVLGLAGSRKFLRVFFVAWALFLLAASLMGEGRPFYLLLIPGPLYNAFILRRFLTGPGLGGFQFDLLLDAQFFLAAAALLAWRLL